MIGSFKATTNKPSELTRKRWKFPSESRWSWGIDCSTVCVLFRQPICHGSRPNTLGNLVPMKSGKWAIPFVISIVSELSVLLEAGPSTIALDSLGRGVARSSMRSLRMQCGRRLEVHNFRALFLPGAGWFCQETFEPRVGRNLLVHCPVGDSHRRRPGRWWNRSFERPGLQAFPWGCFSLEKGISTKKHLLEPIQS